MAVRDFWSRAAAVVVTITGIITPIAAFVAIGAIGCEQRVGAAAGRGGENAAQTSEGRRSVTDGVYTVEQARRGREHYRKRCVLCHLDNGQGHRAVPVIPGESLEREGDAEAPPIVGEAFFKQWNGRTVRELFEKLASTMPVGSAGTLKPQEYADVLAYILEMNKFPAGKQELTPAREELERIAIGKGN